MGGIVLRYTPHGTYRSTVELPQYRSKGVDSQASGSGTWRCPVLHAVAFDDAAASASQRSRPSQRAHDHMVR